MERRQAIENLKAGKTVLGIEFGSTRIKAVLIGPDFIPMASGGYEWENRFENGIWTYPLEDVWKGLQSCYRALTEDVQAQYGVSLQTVRSIGFSAMMHGYLAFDGDGQLLVPFRTWRNTTTAPAAEELSQLFQFNIPQRWSVAHLYQAMLNREEHLPQIRYLTTLSGYVHWMLTGEKVLGVGDASGMFPIDSSTGTYDQHMVELFDQKLKEYGLPYQMAEIFPKVLSAGEDAGVLTEKGARLLDPTGTLQAGIPLCPPEGDAGTGMAATASVAARSGNVSAGTSVFAMVVLEKPLEHMYPEIDMVTTPDGKPVAMVHCNNCTSDINAWVNLFGEALSGMGMQVKKNDLYAMLFKKALEGENDCGGLLSYNYDSGEPITGFEQGRPLVVRTPDSLFNLANFMRTHLYSAVATLKIGMDLLFEKEHVALDLLMGHGGYFKTREVGQPFMAAAMNVPVAVMETAGEGGAWGIALLASYLTEHSQGQSLEDYLNQEVFHGSVGIVEQPDSDMVKGFNQFLERYKKGIEIQAAAVRTLE